MRLTFDSKLLLALARHWELRLHHGTKARTLYGEDTGPGFWLVGDDGVYLMPNWPNGKDKPSVVYANECNPTTMPFDQWWDMKRDTFGGDDGAEFVSLQGLTDILLKCKRHLVVTFTADRIAYGNDLPTPPVTIHAKAS